jgi:hypothetical protein
MNQGILRGISVDRLLTWIAVGSVGVFLVWSAIRIREIAAPMYLNSDIASAPVLAELFPDRGSGAVVLGYYPWLESLFALDLTRWVPSHVEFWKAAPFVVYGATVVLVGLTVRRAISTRAGLLVALAMAAPEPFVISMLGSPDQRLPTLVHTVILAAFLVTLPALGGWGRAGRGVWAAALALTLAPGVSSDPLLLVLSAVLPFLCAVGLGWRLNLLRLEVAALAAGACLAGVLGGELLQRLAEHDEIIFNNDSFTMASSGRVLSNIGLLLEDIALFAQGKFANGEVPINAFNALRELVAIVAVAATVVFAIVVARVARPILADQARPAEQRLLGIYWVVSILAVSAGFVMITAPVGSNSVRYVTTLWPALLTTIVIVYGRRALNPLALLAAGCAVLGCIGLARGIYTPGPGPNPNAQEAQLLEQYVANNDLDHGYAGYWVAAPLTLQTDFEALVYPIEPCLLPKPDRYCPYRLHTIEDWYAPRPGVRSFYVVSDVYLEPATRPPPRRWGDPFKTARFGNLTVYAYDYDIATMLDPTVPGEGGFGVQ